MPVASSTTTTKKVSSPAVGRRSSSVIKVSRLERKINLNKSVKLLFVFIHHLL